MNKLCLSWCIGVGERASGGRSSESTWKLVYDLLLSAKASSGSITLDKNPIPDVGASSLQVMTARGRSVLMLGVNTEDDHDVRAYTNPKGSPGVMVEILGDYWSERMICNDYDVVIECFKQFWETGDVSPDLLN